MLLLLFLFQLLFDSRSRSLSLSLCSLLNGVCHQRRWQDPPNRQAKTGRASVEEHEPSTPLCRVPVGLRFRPLFGQAHPVRFSSCVRRGGEKEVCDTGPVHEPAGFRRSAEPSRRRVWISAEWRTGATLWVAAVQGPVEASWDWRAEVWDIGIGWAVRYVFATEFCFLQGNQQCLPWIHTSPGKS